jgi:adenylate cyclase class 2
MDNQGQELEVKFYLQNPGVLEERLRAAGAQAVQPRTHEVNLRFDTPEYDFLRTHQVLRLRKDQGNRVTYKGVGDSQGGVRRRREIEFTVSDFETARQFFEALGYVVILMYEKYRTTFQLDEVLITLDEMPYGNFTEVEGPQADSIRKTSQLLDLDWNRRILDSYTALFDLLKAARKLEFRDLSFENFKGLTIEAHDMHLLPADNQA